MRNALGIALGAALLLAGAIPLPALAAPSTGPTGTSEFRGVNWADPRDNYADDEVVPSGLSTGDDYRTTYAKASDIVLEFRHEVGANTVRLPINPSSVGTEWWESYQGAIDAATRHGFKVILSYWEGDDAKDGRVDDQAAFDAMWDTVVAEYGKNPQRLLRADERAVRLHARRVGLPDLRVARRPRRRSAQARDRLGNGLQRRRHRRRRGRGARGHPAVAALLRVLGRPHHRGGVEAEPAAANRRVRLAYRRLRGGLADDDGPQLRQSRGRRLHLVPRRPHRGGPGPGHRPRLLAGPSHERRLHAHELGRRRRPRGDERVGPRAAPVGLGPPQGRSSSTTCPRPLRASRS